MGKLTHTVSGNPVSFKSADKSNIESLKVYFDPIQIGIGDTSPSNIKPISGWTNINYFQTSEVIPIIPINFTPIELNGGTLNYLDKSTFFISGTLTSNTTFSIPIESFTLKKNKTYNKVIIIEAQGAYVGGILSAGIGFKYNDSSFFSLTLTPLSQPINVWNHSSDWTKEDQDVNTLNIILRTGWSNVKVKFLLTENPINESIIQFDQTIYGGYIDLITGTLVSDTIVFNLTGSEDYLTYQSNTHRLRIKDFNLTYGWSIVPPISNVFKTATDSNFSVYFATTSSGNQNLNLGFPSDYTEEQARNFIAQNNVQVVCKVSHTTTYQLTPQQLKTFCGQNNIWSNTNNEMEITYEFTDHMAKRRLELNIPHIETISGNTASFNTDMIAPLKECKVTFFPAQDPYASPSPINVKNITGWNGIQFQTNRNFIPVIPDNFTTGQLGTSNGIINYLGDNTYEYIGTIEDSGSILIPIQPIQLLANTNYYVRIVKEPENGLNTSDTALNIAMKTASGSNIFIFRPNQIGWSNYSCGAYTNLEEDLEAAFLAIGIPSGSSSFKFKFFLGTSSFALTTVNWNSEYGTIYGGYIDLSNGKLVQTHHKITFDGTEQIANSYALQDDQFIRVQFFSNDNEKILHSKRLPDQNLSSCKYSHGKYEVSNTIDVSKGGVVINNTNNMTLVILHLPIELHVSDNVGIDIRNYLKAQYDNGTPVEICYQLRDPIEYQLSTHIIKTIKDTNYMWSNTNGPIEIKYWTH